MEQIQQQPERAVSERQRIKLSVPSRKRTVRAVVQFVRDLLLSADLTKQTIFQITLSLEEAITNIIRHAYEGDETKDIIATCELDRERVVIRLRDFGRQVDVSQIRSRDLEDYRPGGLGVRLMHDLLDGVEYNTDFEMGTELTLVKRIEEEDVYRDDALWKAVFAPAEGEGAQPPLADDMTGLPTIRGIAEQAAEMYGRDGAVGILLFDAKRFPDRQHLYSYDVLDSLLSHVAKAFQRVAAELLLPGDLLATNRPMYDDFAVVVSAGARGGDLGTSTLEEVARSIESSVVASVTDSLDDALRPLFEIRRGEGLVRGAADPQRALYEGVKDAGRALARRRAQARACIFADLRKGLEEQDVRTLFQPIVSAQDAHVLGYEAFSLLTRTESRTIPSVLFDTALEANLSWELDKLCLERALARCADGPSDGRFFLNIETESLVHPECTDLAFAREIDLPLGRVVLELNARSLPRSWDLLCESVAALRQQGLSFCVAGVNTDLTSLAFVDRVRPDFVEFDPLLIRGCAADSLKRDLLRVLLTRCRELGCSTIAMGVETDDDFRAVGELGIDHAQGYYVAEPTDGFSAPQSVPSALVGQADEETAIDQSEEEAEEQSDSDFQIEPSHIPQASGSDLASDLAPSTPTSDFTSDFVEADTSSEEAPTEDTPETKRPSRAAFHPRAKRKPRLAFSPHPLQIPSGRRPLG